MTEIVIAEPLWHELIAAVRHDGNERCAVLLANEVQRPGGGRKLLGHTIISPHSADYSRTGAREAELTPAFVARVSKAALLRDARIIFVHSHPGESLPAFSPVDDKGEARLAQFLHVRQPETIHGSMVVSVGGVAARELGAQRSYDVVAVGRERRVLTHRIGEAQADNRFDRQVRALGATGQRALEHLTVGIVGLGGTGSIVAQELSYLGVKRFILLDPDVIEETNLNRVLGAVPADIGQAKVDVARRFIAATAPTAYVLSRAEDVIYARSGRTLLDSDLVFCCTDSHGSRAVVEQIAYQYLIPTIDMGAVIAASRGRITHVVGRVQLLSPGLACLTCSDLLDYNQVRRDMMTAYERKSDPYIVGDQEPAPAVISLNGVVSSLAVTMMLAVVTGLPVRDRSLIYRALSSSVRSILSEPEPNCVVCSTTGRLARGDALSFPGRQD